VILGPAQIHPEKHFRPVLRLGAAGARLDVEVRIIRVHLAGEHAPELQALHARFEALQVAFDFCCRIRIALLDGERQQFTGILQSVRDLVQPGDDLFQPGPLLSECLRALGVVPDIRLLQLALDLDQPFRLLLVVKDTSSTRRCVR
jgi:hypothetical protein